MDSHAGYDDGIVPLEAASPHRVTVERHHRVVVRVSYRRNFTELTQDGV